MVILPIITTDTCRDELIYNDMCISLHIVMVTEMVEVKKHSLNGHTCPLSEASVTAECKVPDKSNFVTSATPSC